MQKEHRFTMKLSDEELQMLKRLSKLTGENMSVVARRAIRELAERMESNRGNND